MLLIVEETVDVEMANPLKNAKPSLGESGVYLTDSSCDDTNIYGSTTTNELLAGAGSETCSVSTSALLADSAHDVHHRSQEPIHSTPDIKMADDDESAKEADIFGSTTTNELLAGAESETCSVSTSALLADSAQDLHHQSQEPIHTTIDNTDEATIQTDNDGIHQAEDPSHPTPDNKTRLSESTENLDLDHQTEEPIRQKSQTPNNKALTEDPNADNCQTEEPFKHKSQTPHSQVPTDYSDKSNADPDLSADTTLQSDTDLNMSRQTDTTDGTYPSSSYDETMDTTQGDLDSSEAARDPDSIEDITVTQPLTTGEDIPFVDSANSSEDEEEIPEFEVNHDLELADDVVQAENAGPVFGANNDMTMTTDMSSRPNSMSNKPTSQTVSKPPTNNQPTPPNTPMETDVSQTVSPGGIEQLLESWVEDAVKLSEASPIRVNNDIAIDLDSSFERNEELMSESSDIDIREIMNDSDTRSAQQDVKEKLTDATAISEQPNNSSRAPKEQQEVVEVIAPAASISTLESYKPGATADPKRSRESIN